MIHFFDSQHPFLVLEVVFCASAKVRLLYHRKSEPLRAPFSVTVIFRPRVHEKMNLCSSCARTRRSDVNLCLLPSELIAQSIPQFSTFTEPTRRLSFSTLLQNNKKIIEQLPREEQLRNNSDTSPLNSPSLVAHQTETETE